MTIATQQFPAIKDPNSGNEEERFLLHIMGNTDLKFFRIILRRSLNCLPPHEDQWKQWFELCDKLDTILGV